MCYIISRATIKHRPLNKMTCCIIMFCVINRAQEFESNVEAMKVEYSERHIQAQDRLATLDRQVQEFRSHSEGTAEETVGM